MFSVAAPVALHALDRADALLDKATPNMLCARLVPGMFDCGEQLSTVAGFALRTTHRAGFAYLDQSAADYLHQFAIPNLWFHLSMAYAILRQAGADVGKADFDGLHSYPTGFAFDA